MKRKEKQPKGKPALKEDNNHRTKRRLKDKKEKYRHSYTWLDEDDDFDLDLLKDESGSQHPTSPK